MSILEGFEQCLQAIWSAFSLVRKHWLVGIILFLSYVSLHMTFMALSTTFISSPYNLTLADPELWMFVAISLSIIFTVTSIFYLFFFYMCRRGWTDLDTIFDFCGDKIFRFMGFQFLYVSAVMIFVVFMILILFAIIYIFIPSMLVLTQSASNVLFILAVLPLSLPFIILAAYIFLRVSLAQFYIIFQRKGFVKACSKSAQLMAGLKFPLTVIIISVQIIYHLLFYGLEAVGLSVEFLKTFLGLCYYAFTPIVFFAIWNDKVKLKA